VIYETILDSKRAMLKDLVAIAMRMTAAITATMTITILRIQWLTVANRYVSLPIVRGLREKLHLIHANTSAVGRCGRSIYWEELGVEGFNCATAT
jgi:hypothetical protein